MAGRFSFVSSDYIDKRIKERVPINTQKCTKWSVNTWNAWINERNDARMLGQPRYPTALQLQFISPHELDEILCYFVLEVRNKQGKLYPKDSLYNLVCGIARYMKEDLKRPDLNFMNASNPQFHRFRQTLDSQMKLVTEEGIGAVKKQAQPISQVQEEELWHQGVLNCNTALGMSRAVYFYNCKVFGLRARDEHRNLKVEQFSFGSDDSGQFVKLNGRVSKNVTGGFAQRQVQLKEIKQYDNDNEVSVYKIFKSYTNYIGNSGPFYKKPLLSRYPGDVQFSDQTVPQKKLGSYVKDMMTDAGFTGHYTGHSGKVTVATTLFNQGVDEQLIKERTGHRSDAVRCYKRTSSEQQKVISGMVDVPNGQKPEKENIPISEKPNIVLPLRKRKILGTDTNENQLLDEMIKNLLS